MSPQACQLLTGKGFNVVIEQSAGEAAKFLDSDYVAAGAKIVSTKDAFDTDIVLKVDLATLFIILFLQKYYFSNISRFLFW